MSLVYIAILAWLTIQQAEDSNDTTKITLTKDDYRQLKGLDGVLGIIIHAMQTNIPIKVSLKSRKVYIGAVISEQFENVDADNIVIIPYLSGYRDKNTLSLVPNCNYTEMYKKNKLLADNDDRIQLNPEKIDDFKLLIRVEEIETVSLFHIEYYRDFEQNKNTQTPKEIKQTPSKPERKGFWTRFIEKL